MQAIHKASIALVLLATASAGSAATQKEIGSAQHRIVTAQLDAIVSGHFGATALPTVDCANDVSGATTLARDVLFYLAALDGSGRVSGACESGPPGQLACRVMIGESVAGTERRWSRIYQFLRLSNGEVEPGTLFCSTIP
jgi:hypothetical protein